MTAESLDDLNSRVTDAIFRAEHAPSGSLDAEAAWREVSELERKIAVLTSSDSVDGALARVGAVSAALRAGDWLRAAQHADVFGADAPDELRAELEALARDADDAASAVEEPMVRPITFSLRAA